MTTRFLAAVAELQVFTADGRYLDLPSRDTKIFRQGKALVLAPPQSRHHGMVLGFMDCAAVVGTYLVAGGELYRGETADPYIRMLKTGVFFLEIDLHPERREITAESSNAVMFKDWSVQGAHAGQHPCWKLPPMTVWEAEQ